MGPGDVGVSVNVCGLVCGHYLMCNTLMIRRDLVCLVCWVMGVGCWVLDDGCWVSWFALFALFTLFTIFKIPGKL